MLCEECQTEPATVHVTRIVNNQKSEINLCAKCAQKRGETGIAMEPSFAFHSILAGLFEPESLVMSHPARPRADRCTQCGMSLSEFRRSGQLGCSHCYVQFERELQPLLRRIHRSAEHVGKTPLAANGRHHLQREVERLRERLRQAVAREAFEEAARLRDEIRRLEQRLADPSQQG